HTAPSAFDDVALRPILLDAEAERAPPEVGLVDVYAAGVEADVAADRAHSSDLRSGDVAAGLGEHRHRAEEYRIRRERVEVLVAPIRIASDSSRTPFMASIRQSPTTISGVTISCFMFGRRSVPPAIGRARSPYSARR